MASVVVAILGLMLSLFVPRRRLWVRAVPQDGGATLVEVGGLARTETGGLEDELDRLVQSVQTRAPETRPEPPEERP